MARALRIEYEDAVYHVTARGNERRKIFFTKLIIHEGHEEARRES